MSPQYHATFDDEFATVPFIRSGEIPSPWTALVQSCTASSTDEVYFLTTSWIKQTDTYPLDGLSNEKVSGTL